MLPRTPLPPHRRGHLASPCAQYEDPTARINSLSFHRTADLLVTASDDDSIRLYNTQTGVEDRCGCVFVYR